MSPSTKEINYDFTGVLLDIMMSSIHLPPPRKLIVSKYLEMISYLRSSLLNSYYNCKCSSRRTATEASDAETALQTRPPKRSEEHSILHI